LSAAFDRVYGANAMTTAEHALGLIADGSIVGLGTGQAAEAFVRALAARVQAGLRVRGVPTSATTAALATRLGIPLTTLDAVEQIDVTVDGADEVDPALNLIKGYGGALVREKIVAAVSARLVILVGVEKLVPVLGTRGRLPVEVVPFGLAACQRALRARGLAATPRAGADGWFVTDNGNHILDCAVSAIVDPRGLDEELRGIPGVVGTGLFVAMADTVLVQDEERVQVRRRA
jgi:ribose 5-phosphate isomerase A